MGLDPLRRLQGAVLLRYRDGGTDRTGGVGQGGHQGGQG